MFSRSTESASDGVRSTNAGVVGTEPHDRQSDHSKREDEQENQRQQAEFVFATFEKAIASKLTKFDLNGTDFGYEGDGDLIRTLFAQLSPPIEQEAGTDASRNNGTTPNWMPRLRGCVALRRVGKEFIGSPAPLSQSSA